MKFQASLLTLCALINQTVAFVANTCDASATSATARFGYSPSSSQGSASSDATSPGTSSKNFPGRGNDVWKTMQPVHMQGQSLRTWSLRNPNVQRVQVLLRSQGRPLHSTIDLWHGPDHTPQRIAFFSEDGNLRPFSAFIETPGGPTSVAIRNTGFLEYPMEAIVAEDVTAQSLTHLRMKNQRTIQGGALQSFPFDPTVQSVALLLQSDGRPMSAHIELLQGPNNNKQVMDVYSEDGQSRPFYVVIETPGSGNVLRIVNTGMMEFPIAAGVVPLVIDPNAAVTSYMASSSSNDPFSGSGLMDPNFGTLRYW